MATFINSQIHTVPELVTLTEIKQQLKLSAIESSEDELLQQYIEAAIISAENYTCTSINEAKFLIEQTAWENGYKIPLSPVQTIDTVKYTDEAGDEQTLDSAEYQLRTLDSYAKEIYYPNFDQLPKIKEASYIEITVTTGYASADVLPKVIKQAILLIASAFYYNRADSVEALPKASTNLLRKYKFHY